MYPGIFPLLYIDFQLPWDRFRTRPTGIHRNDAAFPSHSMNQTFSPLLLLLLFLRLEDRVVK